MRVISVLWLAFCILIQVANGMSLQEILNRHTDALGGRENLKQIKSYVIYADVSLGGMNGTSVSYFRDPGCVRTDIRLPLMNSSQGCKGDSCWISDNKGATQSLGVDMRSMMVTEAAFRDWSYCDSATFLGTLSLDTSLVKVDSSACYVVRINPRGGSPITMYVDTATYLPRRTAMKTDYGLFYSSFYDLRPVRGILMPFRTTEATDAGFVMGISVVKDIQVNVDLPDSFFVPPTARKGDTGLPAGADSVVVPFDLWHNHIYIDAHVNGQGPFRFIFDSGAGGVAVNKRLAKAISLAHLGVSEARGVGGADSSDIYQIDSLKIAGIRLTELPGSAIDLTPLERSTEARIDGIIGYDLLSRFVITVGYSQHSLIVYRPDIQLRKNWGADCKLTIDLRLPYVDATVEDTILGRFRLDTGSASTIDFHTPFVMAHRLLEKASSRTVVASGIGGSVEGKVGMSPRMSLCSNEIKSQLVHFSSTETGVFAGANTAGNIGAGVLKSFSLTFDYGREKVYLLRSASPDSAFATNYAGLALAVEDEKAVVKRVAYGCAADGFVLPGDVLVEVDGKETERKSVKEIETMLNGRRGSDVRIKIERKGRVQEMDLLLDSWY